VLRAFGLAVALTGALATMWGCSRHGTKTQDFTPPGDKARQALEAALNHWQSGNPHGSVPGTTPTVEVMDVKWRSGQKLKSYEILGEEPGTEPRFFKVRLTPAQGPQVDVRYAVVGIDPLWVYREEDFKALSGTGK
jgi:hypothetical protein